MTTKASLADAFTLAFSGRGSERGQTRHAPIGSADLGAHTDPRMGDFLLVTIQVDMHDRLAMSLQDDLTSASWTQHSSRGVLIDISSLEMVDSFIGRMLGNIASMSRMLDAETVVVGMRPAVAITLVELGMSLHGVRTALDVEKGMQLLRKSLLRRVEEDADASG